MPTVFHPRALDSVDGHPPASVTVGGDSYAVDDNGRVGLPDDGDVRALARAYDIDPAALAPEFEDSDGDDGTDEEDDGGPCPHCDDY